MSTMNNSSISISDEDNDDVVSASSSVPQATSDDDGGDSNPAPGPSKTITITPEARARMERNRLAAQKRLQEKSAALQEVFDAYRIESSSASCGGEGPSPVKKKKESQYMTELKNVVSEGSVVRVHGTKLIDTGGGFLIEESDLVEQEEAEKVIIPHVAPFIPTDVPTCKDCSKEFQDSFLFKYYDYKVCDSCKDTDDKHRLITRTDEKNEYLLKDVDLDKREPILKFMTKPNPHNSRWGDMKLYLQLQVEERAIEVWGSLEKIEEQHEVREENRVKTKIKKYNKKMKDLRMSARSSLFTKDFSPHEHTWGPETCIDEEEDKYQHVCTECGQEEIYEKM